MLAQEISHCVFPRSDLHMSQIKTKSNSLVKCDLKKIPNCREDRTTKQPQRVMSRFGRSCYVVTVSLLDSSSFFLSCAAGICPDSRALPWPVSVCLRHVPSGPVPPRPTMPGLAVLHSLGLCRRFTLVNFFNPCSVSFRSSCF